METLKRLVDLKIQDWLGNPQMEMYLRPATIFNATKCEQYVGALDRKKAPVPPDLTRRNLQAVQAFAERGREGTPIR